MPEPQNHSFPTGGMPETPVGRWVQPFAQFLKIQSASGFLLLICTAIALLLANSLWSASFADIWQIRLGFAVGNFELNKPLLLWINDGLMTVFFFVVGLEIKREFVMGELRDSRKVECVVAYVSAADVPAGDSLLANPPVVLTDSELVRLSPVTQHRQTVIGCEQMDDFAFGDYSGLSASNHRQQ